MNGGGENEGCSIHELKTRVEADAIVVLLKSLHLNKSNRRLPLETIANLLYGVPHGSVLGRLLFTMYITLLGSYDDMALHHIFR